MSGAGGRPVGDSPQPDARPNHDFPAGGALFHWTGHSGAVSDPNNWDFVLGDDNRMMPPPGALDLAIIQSASNIAVTGALNVNGASIGTEVNTSTGTTVTMTGSVTAGLNGVSAENAVFQGTVTTTALVVTGFTVTFQSSVSAAGLSAGGGQTTFASGSSLAATGPVLTAGTLTFTGGASGSSHTGTPALYAANPDEFFSNTTALQVNDTLALNGGTFTATGDTAVGVGTLANPSTIQITNGGSLVTTGTLHVGTTFATGNQIQSGAGLVTVDSGTLQAQHINVGDGGPGTLNIKNGGQVTSMDSNIALGADAPGTVDIATNGKWTVTGNFFVGLGGEGQMTVESGGTFNVSGKLSLSAFPPPVEMEAWSFKTVGSSIAGPPWAPPARAPMWAARRARWAAASRWTAATRSGRTMDPC